MPTVYVWKDDYSPEASWKLLITRGVDVRDEVLGDAARSAEHVPENRRSRSLLIVAYRGAHMIENAPIMVVESVVERVRSVGSRRIPRQGTDENRKRGIHGAPRGSRVRAELAAQLLQRVSTHVLLQVLEKRRHFDLQR